MRTYKDGKNPRGIKYKNVRTFGYLHRIETKRDEFKRLNMACSKNGERAQVLQKREAYIYLKKSGSE